MIYVLIHSPLVGPFTWSAVAAELERRGRDVLVPHLHDEENSTLPYWKQHAESVRRAVEATRADARLVLVGHSGAGPILPVIRTYCPRNVAGYIFVDAGLARDGTSRLDEIKEASPEWAREFESSLKSGARFPNWTDEQLREIIPDEETRGALLHDLNPRTLEFFQEPIPVFQDIQDVPCAYLQFSAVYDRSAQEARTRGWLCRRLDGGHFHMLVEPETVTDALVELANALV